MLVRMRPQGCTGDSWGRPPSLRVEDPADMFAPLLKKLFGSKNEREVKRMLKTVNIAGILNRQKPAPEAGAEIDELDGEIAAAEREAQAIIERMQKGGNVH